MFKRICSLILFCRYDIEFFLNVVNGMGIVSWGAVDISRSDGHIDELIGFVTTRIMTVKESEVAKLHKTSRKKLNVLNILKSFLYRSRI